MTIAGSDSGGGAGIQADLKTFAALGVYGTSVITAITAQNTLGVTAIHEVPADVITAQIEAVITDIGADAVKTGMLSSALIIEAVANRLRQYRVPTLVMDPVMVSKSGDRLLQQEALQALRTELIPLAAVVTPNLPEAEALTDMQIVTGADIRHAAERITGMGARGVVIKGGHQQGPATDLFYDGSRFQEFSTPRVNTPNTHGTGCTFASAIAAGLARGMDVIDAVALAKEYVTEAIRRSFSIGQGPGPLNHFYKLWG